jgi:hypothetical protein
MKISCNQWGGIKPPQRFIRDSKLKFAIGLHYSSSLYESQSNSVSLNRVVNNLFNLQKNYQNGKITNNGVYSHNCTNDAIN